MLGTELEQVSSVCTESYWWSYDRLLLFMMYPGLAINSA